MVWRRNFSSASASNVAESVSSISTVASAGLTAAGYEQQAAQHAAAQRDRDCIRKALSGDRGAFADLALAWQDRIYNALRKMTGNEQDAADLTQETFLRALSSLSSFRNESSAYTWLFRIAMNLAASRHRQLARRKTTQESQIGPAYGEDQRGVFDRQPSTDETPERSVEKQERNRVIMEALGRLSEEQRTLLVLRDIEQVEYQQIAEMLDVPLGTLKSRLFRARLALREELEGYFQTHETVTQ